MLTQKWEAFILCTNMKIFLLFYMTFQMTQITRSLLLWGYLFIFINICQLIILVHLHTEANFALTNESCEKSHCNPSQLTGFCRFFNKKYPRKKWNEKGLQQDWKKIHLLSERPAFLGILRNQLRNSFITRNAIVLWWPEGF